MFKLVSKDLKLFLKDRRAVLLTFAIPIALITLFAFAFGGVGSSKAQRIDLQVTDLDYSMQSKQAVNLLDSLESVQLSVVDLATAQKNIKTGTATCVLILHKGFNDSLLTGRQLPIELQYDAAKNIQIGLLQQALIPTMARLPFMLGNPKEAMKQRFMNTISNSSPNLQAKIGRQSDNLFSSLEQGVSDKSSQQALSKSFFGGQIKMTPLIKAKSENSIGLIQAVAGTAVMMLLFSVVGIGTSILDEKQEGTLKRLLYTPINPIKIVFGKMISANIISIIQLLILLLFAHFAFGLIIFTNWLAVLIIVMATAFACSAFGVFLAAIAKSRQQVQGLSTLIILVMSAIGGSMVPLFLMPEFMQKAAVVSVNYWSIQGFFDIFWRQLPVYDATFLGRVAVLIGIGILLNALAVIFFKKNVLSLS